jgi:2-hydroxychromene-2-carboxylate isomerase
MVRIDFWYEFASPYSYLTAMRIEAVAEAAGVDVRWRPFLLGPVFQAQGMHDSPFNIFPVKGAYMWRDMARQSAAIGISFTKPEQFPQSGLLAPRVAIAGGNAPWVKDFSKGVYAAEFGAGRIITEKSVIADVLAACGQDAAALMGEAATDGVKAKLRAQTEEAIALGVFGAPSFVAPDGELFWGNDRLEAAIAWVTEKS